MSRVGFYGKDQSEARKLVWKESNAGLKRALDSVPKASFFFFLEAPET